MGGRTPPKTPANSRIRLRAFRCTVELDLHSITCPGVVLPSQEDVYISVRIMGQYHKTKCVPSTFPLLLQEKMVFMKKFAEAVDPGDVADHLENDTTCFELIQLIPPEGEVLATLEENTRDFLYPSLRLTPHTTGSQREILMKKSVSFPGISPRVEFSTTSVIEECDLKRSQSAISLCCPSPGKPCRARASPRAEERPRPSLAAPCGYQRPTAASLSRCPSPYTHRRMCQLSEITRQRLSQLQLGPYTFRKETTPQPPFVVPCSPNSLLIEAPTSPALLASPKRSAVHQTSGSPAADFTDPALCGSFRSKPFQEGGHSRGGCHISPERACARLPRSPPRCKTPAAYSTPVPGGHGDQSPLLSRSSLRQRFQDPSSPSQWERIHSRVQRILRTHSTRCKLSFEEPRERGGASQNPPAPSCYDSVCGSQTQLARVVLGEPCVHLDNGTFWTNKAAKYSGKPHRAVFEDSLGKIYKNLYRKASSSHSDSQSIWTQ
ncbi:spermatogenesis-associated protein 6 [Electrophorus electricus]|uniref:Spermatogenesis-associated protein 6 N-terminal domain-containing protein n=1 Tax=Electrophorus electricus TaxID=8005 RepID=A0A4W4DW08_ELEEL|nr:spermatogenesis-associated protein 6 [Electrophorus electricus]